MPVCAVIVYLYYVAVLLYSGTSVDSSSVPSDRVSADREDLMDDEDEEEEEDNAVAESVGLNLIPADHEGQIS